MHYFGCSVRGQLEYNKRNGNRVVTDVAWPNVLYNFVKERPGIVKPKQSRGNALKSRHILPVQILLGN
jgi:hypothetical protein